MNEQNPYDGPPPGGPSGWPGQGGPPGPPGPGPEQPSGGYAFGPFAPQDASGQLPPYGPGPYGPGGQYPGQPPAGPPPGPKAGRAKLWLVIGAATLALLLIGIIAVVALTRAASPDPAPDPAATATATETATASQAPTTGSNTQAPPPTTATAAEAVEGYLQALARGDAAAALAYAAEPPADDTLLTQKVFAKARRAAPVSRIVVEPPSGVNPGSVNASYRLAKEQVQETFTVQRVGDVWKLDKVAAEIDVALVRALKVPVVVNGVRVESSTVYALPGAYTITTGLKTLSWGSRNVVTVRGPNAAVDTYRLNPKLTKRGKKALIAATKKNFTNCLKAKKLKPKGCPFKQSDNGYRIQESTITWRRVGPDPFKKAIVTSFGTSASVAITFKVAMSATCRGGAARCTGDYGGTNVANYDLTKKLKPKWTL